MSCIMMARRLLGAGLNRPATPSPTRFTSSLENISLQNHGGAAARPRRPLHDCPFGSAARARGDSNPAVVELPPNLKFDPRAKSSPFYGAERVGPGKNTKGGERGRTRKGVAKQIGAGASVVDIDVELAGGKKVEDIAEDPSEAVADETGEGTDEHEDCDSDDEEAEERILYNLSTKPDVPRAVPLPQRLCVPVMDFRSGEQVGTIHLSERTFGNDPVRVDILHRVVVWQRNKKRGRRNAGARTKTVAEVSGSGRKVRRQKGTGRARAGHSRPAHWRGGAKAHGPKGRVQDYTTKLNKKVRRMGVRHALSQKLKERNLVVVNDLAVPTHKTKELDIMLRRFGISQKKGGASALICDDADPDDAEDEHSVYGGLNVNVKVASGNLPKIQVMNQNGCHVYGMLKFKKLVLSLAAVRSLETRLERDL